jgi:D-amino-acid dehydrogenase
MPYVFPRAPREIARGALNLDPRAHIRYGALPAIGPAVFRYFAASTPAGKNATARAMAPLLAAASAEHLKLAEAAGADALLRRGGWIKAFRSARGEDMAAREAEELKPYGIAPKFLDRAALIALEPNLSEKAIGGAHYADPLSTPDPEALAQSYAALSVKRGGRFETGDALSLETARGGWMVKTTSGRLAARDVVIALGPWSGELARRFGLRLPFFVKRGYHMHYEAKGNAGLTRPVLDLERGYLVTPMARGLRLTTGAEFARRDDPPSPAQLEKVEPFARELFPIGARKDSAPWLGRRPCLPDMRPVIGPFPGKPGLWLDSGHHHLGLTLGPVSGRLLAELMSGETPLVDPAPFRAERFGR